MAAVAIPYLEILLASLEGGHDSERLKRNVHWGLFPDDVNSPAGAFADAVDRLTSRMLEMLAPDDGMRILDVGCGFGGALDRLDVERSGANLVGINIDLRQLEHAVALGGRDNVVTLIAADGCTLPIATGSVDRVLALESIFHFPTRRGFLHEAARVLRRGGRLVASDFVADRRRLAELGAFADSTGAHLDLFAPTDEIGTSVTYERWARSAGLRTTADEDVTRQTMPTYPALRYLLESSGHVDSTSSVDWLEEASRRGLLQYRLMRWERVR